MRIAREATKPVVIADTQDNPGAGGTGDTTGMLAALVHNKAQGAVLGIFYDAAAAAAAHKAGQGAEIEIELLPRKVMFLATHMAQSEMLLPLESTKPVPLIFNVSLGK